MRVAEMLPALAREWNAEQAQPEMAVRASQMNLVLHFGAGVNAEAAQAQWEGALALAQRYPCRIIILCSDAEAAPAAPWQGKLYLGCYVDEARKERRCCEVLSLAYPPHGASGLLENQLSVWKESDLPSYHWFCGIDPHEINRRWLPLIASCRRVLFDSSEVREDFDEVRWPLPQAVRDLAEARLLTTRQALGQLLSGYEPRLLAEKLKEVRVRHAAHRCGEARHLLRWTKDCLEKCAAQTKVALAAEFVLEEAESDDFCLALECRYATDEFIKWAHSRRGNGAQIETNLGGVVHVHPMRVPFPDLPHALAEALIF